jgi:ribosomal-protein-alanine N-acetyltransferase
MNAVLKESRRVVAMQAQDLGEVLAVENAAYEFPWSRGNFVDSLAAGHVAVTLLGPQGELLGYLLALPGFEELHLLNLTVAPAEQGRGHARFLLDWLVEHCRQQAAPKLWLEVRQGNERARRVYERFGFVRVGQRRGYYPAAEGRREDAVVMSLEIPVPGNGGRDALV